MPYDQTQHPDFSTTVKSVLGDKLQELLPQQLKALDNALDRILDDHQNQAELVTPEEIQGAYELIVDHVYPAEFVPSSVS